MDIIGLGNQLRLACCAHHVVGQLSKQRLEERRMFRLVGKVDGFLGVALQIVALFLNSRCNR
jgi:hypothetical protein